MLVGFAELLDVRQIPGPPDDPLVPDELRPPQHRNLQTFDLHHDAVLRSLFETTPVMEVRRSIRFGARPIWKTMSGRERSSSVRS
jgi:hypothetical protein